MSDALLSPGEVARMFRVHPKTVSRWAQTGKVPSIRTIGGHRRFYRADIERALADSEVDADSEVPEELAPFVSK